MKRFLLAVCALLLTVGPAPAAPDTSTDLRLIVLVAVDQFRYDYLTRFRSEYREGLQKLLTEGAVFTDANLEHYPTVTAIGHATMLTGATPAVSGIIGNDWFDRASGKSVTSVSDPGVQLLGAEGTGSSPHRLLVSTVGDELKMTAAAGRSVPGAPRVIGISLKDRSAILPAGHSADAAYWWDQKTGRFVTSTYYVPEAPAWVTDFNARKLPASWAGKPWSLITAPATVLRTLPAEDGNALYSAVYSSPFGSELLLEFATEALQREQLGQRGGVTDLLSVSFSSNDAVGHTFGPDSPHVRDMAIRTDRILGTLLARIDRLVGLRHTVIALTADHGVSPLPETLRTRLMPGGRLTSKDLFEPIEQGLSRAFGEGKWVLGTAGSSPYLNDALMAQLEADPAAVRREAARVAAGLPHVARVYTRDQLLTGAVPDDRVGRRVLRGFNPTRSGDLEIVLEPYWLRQATGTTHGTPYNYDAHVPLILMGPAIKPGEYTAPVALNDLAPTLATLARVEIPSGSSGRVLSEALQANRPAAARPAAPRDVPTAPSK
jgi:predicted AlkP superfamily pyrophosphatase or phosphodiesterase